ncbi:MAG: hypothetical protein ACOY0T_24640 [Myxococcota bacterium]
MSRIALALCATLLLACRNEAKNADVERVEFGVPFGGDIQDRSQIPIDIEPRELALRVTFRAPLSRERKLSWELERPSNVRASDGGQLFAAELGESRIPSGERSAEAKLALRRNDPPGPWRIRVALDGQSVLDRRFEVLDSSARDKR